MKYQTPESQREIWIIDDDETALMLAQEVLSGTEFRIRTFNNAPEALQALQEGHFPDLIVVDVIMPGMDGFDFCARLRGMPKGATLPVLVATSLDDTPSIHRAYLMGATGFAIKPIHWTLELYHIRYMLRSADVAKELREKELETRLAKEDWERTFNSISDVVTVLDKDLRVIRANAAACKQLGMPLEEIIGRTCHELFYNSRTCGQCPAHQTLKTGQPASVEIACDPGGSICEISTSAVMGQDGKVSHLVHVARDLSRQKQLEAEYRQAQKMEAIGTLAGGIAHDFNNLLTVILGCGETLRDEEADAGRQHEEITLIVDAAKRGAALSRQLMTFSRKEQCRSVVQWLDVNLVIRGVWKMLEKIAPKTVNLQNSLAQDLCRISADPGQLEQVLINLTVNAVHAMSSTGGSITIETQTVDLTQEFCQFHPKLKPGRHVLLSVTDTGCGMSKQIQERIFEPFFTTKKVGQGTGLGLSVVFGIVRDHNGHITCESEENKGATFRIYLPEATQPAAVGTSTPQSKPAYDGGTERVLIVDDEQPIRNLLQRFLIKQGYNADVAPDGETAIKKYANPAERPELVILDLGMPNMNGWECLERLQAIDPQVKVIIATGYGGDDLEENVFAKGAKDFINKPYDLKEMAKKVRKTLSLAVQEATPQPQT